MTQSIQGKLITVRTLAEDFRRLGVEEGMTLLVHSSFKSLGEWVAGGPAAVVLALQEVLGAEGTLVMPTHSGDLSDPAGWSNPPVPREWWEEIRREMPAYDPELTPLRGMGVIPDTFRRQKDAFRSAHPLHSFTARGRHAAEIAAGHELAFGLGDASPLSRIYDRTGFVLLLGVGHLNNTSLHLAEYRASWPDRKITESGAPIMENGARRWASFPELEWDSEDFEDIGAAFERETGLVSRGNIAAAHAMLMPQRELVDYGVRWIESNRKSGEGDQGGAASG